MRSRASRILLIVGCAFWMAACSGGRNEVAPISVVTAPPANPPVTTTTSVEISTTTAASAETTTSTTVAETTSTLEAETTTVAPEGPVFSDALGTKVATAPGVNTPGDTRQLLPEGLYVHIAWKGDPNDPSVFTVQPGDEPILEAYANAMLTFYTASLSTVTVDPVEFARYFVDAGDEYLVNFEEARAGGYVGSLGNGVVLRPYVLGDERTAASAVIFDCYLQNESYILREGGVPELKPLEVTGTYASMALIGTTWKVDVIASEAAACL
jgi:hypothetical protein